MLCTVGYIHVIRIESVKRQSQLSANGWKFWQFFYLSATTTLLLRFSGYFCCRFEMKQDGITTLKWIIYGCSTHMYLFHLHFVGVGRPAGRRAKSLFTVNSTSSLGTFFGGQYILSIFHIVEVGSKDFTYIFPIYSSTVHYANAA